MQSGPPKKAKSTAVSSPAKAPSSPQTVAPSTDAKTKVSGKTSGPRPAVVVPNVVPLKKSKKYQLAIRQLQVSISFPKKINVMQKYLINMFMQGVIRRIQAQQWYRFRVATGRHLLRYFRTKRRRRIYIKHILMGSLLSKVAKASVFRQRLVVCTEGCIKSYEKFEKSFIQ
jgi:hypothetical protein